MAAVQLLVKSRASADFANHKGTTALMRASQEGHLDISDILLAAGADVNRKNHEGMNALMLASQRGHGAMVLLLIKSDAMMDEQTAQGSTALMLACKRGHEKCVEVLVAMGAEIFIRDIRSRTACDTATKRGYMELLAILNTQLQVKRTQEHRHAQRTVQLLDMRTLHQEGRLRLSPTERNIERLTQAVKMTLKLNETDPAIVVDDCEDMMEPEIVSFSSSSDNDSTAMDISANITIVSPTPQSQLQSQSQGQGQGLSRSYSPYDNSMTLEQAQALTTKPENVNAVQTLRTFLTASSSTSSATCDNMSENNVVDGSVVAPTKLSPIRPGYATWQWPSLLQRYLNRKLKPKHVITITPIHILYTYSEI